MKILWISNIVFPEVCAELGIKSPVIAGWMYSAALKLIESNNIELTVISPSNGDKFIYIEKFPIKYYLVPNKGKGHCYNKEIEKYYRDINNLYKPDLIHIHGTESPHSLAWVRACGNSKVVVSLQGIVEIYSKFYFGGISLVSIIKCITLRDIIRNDTMIQQKIRMQKRGKYEVELLKNVNNIIGRTRWDKAIIWSLNKVATYHFCNETLRQPFYKNEWRYTACEKYSIFLSQAHYPLKGIHKLIEALPYVLKTFPQTKVYVAGEDFINKPFYRTNGFAVYVKALIKKNSLEKRIVFTDLLSGDEMVSYYQKANIFICPSSIENSPNSIGEAQILGVPCIASYVGGNMDMIEDGKTGFLYRFEDTELLAKRICELFSNPILAVEIGSNGKKAAQIRHDGNTNLVALTKIYHSIINYAF